MSRTLEQINQEYTAAAALAGEKTYHIHIKSDEVEKLTQEREKSLNLMRNLSREAHSVMSKQAQAPVNSAPEATPEVANEVI